MPETAKVRIQKAAGILIVLAFIVSLVAAVTPLVRAADVPFYEDCSAFDTAKWSFYWNKPIAQGGTWVMPYAVGDNRNYQANYRADSGYGTYEIRMKIDGTRLAGINWWIFVYGHYPDYSANQMELDFAEIWHHNAGETSPPIGEYSISFWVNRTSSTMGKGYWYLNTIDRVGINFEDGAYHSFKYVYSASDLVFYLDGAKVWQWSVDCTDKTALGMPIPPMQFMIGCGSKNAPALEAWKMTIDSISFTPEGYSPPVNSPPVAALQVTPASGTSPLAVVYDASASHDSDGSIVSYLVDFGDGSTSSSLASGSHIYASAGSYTIHLAVTDNGGATDTASAVVAVAAPTEGGGVTPQQTLVVASGVGGTTDPVGAVTVNSGTQVTVTATPSDGHVFDHWLYTGHAGGYLTANPLTVAVSSNGTLTPVFAPVALALDTWPYVQGAIIATSIIVPSVVLVLLLAGKTPLKGSRTAHHKSKSKAKGGKHK